MRGRHVTLAAVLLALIAMATPTFAKKKGQNEEGNWNLEPDAAQTERIVAGHTDLFGRMRG